MKIILSRKGFDSSPRCGRKPSPILPDGTLLSLPLPAESHDSTIKYSDLRSVGGHSPSKLVEDLTGKILPSTRTHLDPDLRRRCMLKEREAGWRPLFGPARPSHTHMMNQGVQPGDLILFFGWFRKVDLIDGRYHYVGGDEREGLHVIFGWLQIDKWFPAGPENRKNVPDWARYHPHFAKELGQKTHVYMARKQLSIPGISTRLPGGGAFGKYCETLRLTAPGQKRSIWKLPKSFYPKHGRSPLSFHSELTSWTQEPGYTLLKTQAKGQEFVLDCDTCPAAMTWARRVLACAG